VRQRELQIVTPEAVVISLPTAGLGSRFLARGIDVLIQGAAIFVLLIAASLIAGAGGGGATTAALVVVLLVATVIWLGYPIAFETLWRGRTPGKAALGLRVVTNEGAPIRFRHALVRGILGLVDVWLFWGSVGVITILVSRNEQRFGDMAAGTIVVRERSGAPAPAATVFAPPPWCEAYVANLDVSGVGPAEYEAARSFLLRAGAIEPAARADLAGRLATPTLQRLRHTPPSWMGPELWLACLAAAYQRRHGGPWQGGYGGPWQGGYGGPWQGGYGGQGYGAPAGGYGTYPPPAPVGYQPPPPGYPPPRWPPPQGYPATLPGAVPEGPPQAPKSVAPADGFSPPT
jgi:uncharacterized RDD family membrane protein YckC